MTEYGHFEPVQVHFDDLDPMGVLHNTRYALLVERATNAYWYRLGWSPDAVGSDFTDGFSAVREVKVTFHAPIVGPGEPVVHFWIDRVGTTSCVYGFRVLSPDRSVVYADGHRVIVNLDPRTLRPAPFSDRLRATADPLMRAA